MQQTCCHHTISCHFSSKPNTTAPINRTPIAQTQINYYSFPSPSVSPCQACTYHTEQLRSIKSELPYHGLLNAEKSPWWQSYIAHPLDHQTLTTHSLKKLPLTPFHSISWTCFFCFLFLGCSPPCTHTPTPQTTTGCNARSSLQIFPLDLSHQPGLGLPNKNQ